MTVILGACDIALLFSPCVTGESPGYDETWLILGHYASKLYIASFSPGPSIHGFYHEFQRH